MCIQIFNFYNFTYFGCKQTFTSFIQGSMKYLLVLCCCWLMMVMMMIMMWLLLFLLLMINVIVRYWCYCYFCCDNNVVVFVRLLEKRRGLQTLSILCACKKKLPKELYRKETTIVYSFRHLLSLEMVRLC